MSKSKYSITRGTGILEPYLARLRAKKANNLIPSHLRHGRILDIGCGSYPYFLAHTSFKEKFGIDRLHIERPVAIPIEIQLFNLDVNEKPVLPFDDEFFNVVTLLAVVEHLDPSSMEQLFREVYRVLQVGGIVVMTTPAAWSDGLLRFLAKINLISKQEIDEHAYAYTLPLLGWYSGRAGFSMTKVRFGYFELMLNMWAVAEK